MHTIMNNELWKLTVNPSKQLVYCTMQGFLHEGKEETTPLPAILRQLLQQITQNRAIILDTTELHIMQPRVAEYFLPAFTNCLLENRIKALAHIGTPENIILKLQFERVLNWC